MPTVTVLDKLYGSNPSESFEKLYTRMLKGLDVKLRFVGVTDRKWIQLDVSGQDETVALNLLKREIGFAPTPVQLTSKTFSYVAKQFFLTKPKPNSWLIWVF
jgi:hypothetical protein